jgi:hypothetical protein
LSYVIAEYFRSNCRYFPLLEARSFFVVRWPAALRGSLRQQVAILSRMAW